MKKITLLLLFVLSFSTQAQNVGILPFAEGFNQPCEIAHAGDDRLFVVEQGGVIKVVQADGSVNSTPFLDISEKISVGVERGLLGLAFHPQYSENGYFYVFYTQQVTGTLITARYSVSANPDIADPDSETLILTVFHPNAIHNGGSLKFGPDGYLYISTGDGGWPQFTPNSQDLESNLGKILRIDVDNPTGGLPYGIPAGNPFAGIAGNDEIWALGLRNPWKISFDRTTSDLWIADVGEAMTEEINHIGINDAAKNFGWSCFEGINIFAASVCASDMSIYTSPSAYYLHENGMCSITGGYVYTGTNYPSMLNKYYFSDYCRPRIGMADTTTHDLTYTENFEGGMYYFSTLGEDVHGELYIASMAFGRVYRIVDLDNLNTPQTHNRGLSLSPNPASLQTQIQIPAQALPAVAKVYDLSGKMLLQKNLQEQTNTLDVSGLQNGVYLIGVSDAQGNSSQLKLIKM